MSLLVRAALVCLVFAPTGFAAPEVVRLRTQKVGDTAYFLVAITPPKDLAMPKPPSVVPVEIDHVEDFYFTAPNEGDRRAVVQVPRLVPLDGKTTKVHFGGLIGGELVFLGQRVGDKANASCRLSYPVEAAPAKGLVGLPGDRASAHVELVLAWKDATPVAPPLVQREALKYPERNDLQGRHAWAQAMWFARLEMRAPQAGQFSVSRLLTGYKYDVWAAPLTRATSTIRLPALVGQSSAARPDLFSLVTGAAHLDEAVMLQRLQEPKGFEAVPRTVAVDTLPKVTLAEHDWKKMMAGKSPAAEPLAKLVPHDCYYLTTTSLASFASAWDVLDAWGGSVLRPPQVSDRDHGLRARYERQLCLPTARLRELLGDKGFTSAALVGSDLYWAEGSDVTVLFEPSDKEQLLTALTTLVERTTKSFGDDLEETRQSYRGVAIKGWRTLRREISAYRAEVGGAVVCSNSPVAIRRIIDVHAGKESALGDSLDFHYMRTVFERDAKKEDGFVFLSDAFIRRLVNAPTRVKAMRRQQARATLALASNAALFAGYEMGTLPADTAALLRNSGLEEESLTVPDGKPIAWDGTRKRAVSEVYGTIEHGTPLLELSIDKVTKAEEEAFRAFHRDYMQAWVGFFDPVGIRFGIEPGKTKVEIFILPLINSQEYASLRSLTAGGLLKYDPRSVAPGTVFQLLTNIETWGSDGLGNWLLLHLGGEGLKLDRLARSWIEEELYSGKRSSINVREEFFASRFTLGIAVEDIAAWSPVIHDAWEHWLKPKEGKPVIKERTYRKVTVKQVPIQSRVLDSLMGYIAAVTPAFPEVPPGKLNKNNIYQTHIDKGYYLSFSKKAIEARIDHALGLRKAKPGDTQGIHVALYLAPPGGEGGKTLAAYLDWRSHVKAQSVLAHWEGLYASGLVSPTMKPTARDEAVRRLLGYVPVSPDGTAMTWQTKGAQMRSDHHGTLAAPTFRAKLPADAPLAKLLQTIRSVQAGLRFREDGLHTTITLDWGRD